MRRVLTIVVLVGGVLGLPAGLAQAPAPRRPAAPAAQKPVPPSLDATIRGILQKYRIPAASAGILAQSPDGKTTYYSLNPDTPLIPASNMKLWTTAAALDELGPAYRFSTNLTLVGRIEGDTLHGDLWVTGRGDPTISGRFEGGDRFAQMKRWADELLSAGIRRVTGGVVGDDDFFDDVLRHPDWKPAHYAEWYGAPVCALSFNDNCVDIHWKPGPTLNSPAAYSIDPDVGALALRNNVKTSARNSRDGRYYLVSVGSPTAEALGTVRLSRTIPVQDFLPVDNPTYYFVSTFKQVLESRGIQVAGPAVDRDEVRRAVPRDVPVRRFSVAWSPDLAEIVKVINRRSQNFYAEMLLKTIGKESRGEGSFSGGERAILEFMRRSEIPTEGFRQADGSGLADTNRVKPRQFVALLRVMDAHPARAVFWDSLPVGGRADGSMRNRFQADARQRRLAGAVQAKTGSINSVRALSGACRPDHGKPFYFSVVLNDIPGAGAAGTPAIDEIVLAIHQAIND
ncbi:D-alanyl-D-alanine carboxypeptidase/D-alanyl-D-alanine-endopeptidase [bacterium]|nr:D-alanyl-D-alanine carboxypeptidase/D-alanyl-D-alanine-endopeptidase [bacterium]